MPHEAQIIGAARSELSHEEYRDTCARRLPNLARLSILIVTWTNFVTSLSFHVDAKGSAGWAALKSKMRDDMCAFGFSVAPALFGDLAERLHDHDIAQRNSRIVVENPLARI